MFTLYLCVRRTRLPALTSGTPPTPPTAHKMPSFFVLSFPCVTTTSRKKAQEEASGQQQLTCEKCQKTFSSLGGWKYHTSRSVCDAKPDDEAGSSAEEVNSEHEASLNKANEKTNGKGKGKDKDGAAGSTSRKPAGKAAAAAAERGESNSGGGGGAHGRGRVQGHPPLAKPVASGEKKCKDTASRGSSRKASAAAAAAAASAAANANAGDDESNGGDGGRGRGQSSKKTEKPAASSGKIKGKEGSKEDEKEEGEDKKESQVREEREKKVVSLAGNICQSTRPPAMMTAITVAVFLLSKWAVCHTCMCSWG